MPLILEDPIADLDTSSVTTAIVNDWLSRQVEHGQSIHATRNARTVLSSAFQRGVEWGIVDRNPVRGATSIKPRRKPPRIPTRMEVARLGMTVPEPDEKWRSLLLVAALCGLRPQEQFALRWEHVRDDHLMIREAIMSHRRGMKATKTLRGTREVPMPRVVRDSLMVWRSSAARCDDGDLVWSTSIGSAYTRSSFAQRVWRPWRERAGLPGLQWKHLRHFCVSMLALSGVSMMQVARWMGHASIRTTDEDYGFLFEADTERAMDRLQDLFGE